MFRILGGAEEEGVWAPVKLSFCCLKEGVDPAGGFPDFLFVFGAGTLSAFLVDGGIGSVVSAASTVSVWSIFFRAEQW